jgi:hypothetical protein
MEPFYDYLYAASRLELFIKLNHYLSAGAIFRLQRHVDRLTGKQRELLHKSMQHFSGQLAIHIGQPVALDNTIDILLSLLEELECITIRKELDKRGLLDINRKAENQQSMAPEDTLAGAANAIRAATELIYKYCVEELSKINRALGRDKSRSITIDDMYARANGKYIRLLIDSIDRQSAV